MIAGRNVHAQTVEKIASWITQERFAPGENLPVEQAIGAELGVSRTVVREAIKTLAAKGMVRTRARTGTRVLPHHHWNIFDALVLDLRLQSAIDDAFIDDLIAFRLVIEPAAAAMAARNADAEARGEMLRCLETMAHAVAEHGDYFSADLAFHTQILITTGNQFFQSLAPLISSVLQGSFKLSVRGQESIEGSLPLHTKVANAIAVGAPERAHAALTQLIELARSDILAERAERAANRPKKERRIR